MNNVIYDNIVFNLQKSGGISVYWYELSKRLVNEKNFNTQFLEYNGCENNIFRKNFKLDDSAIIHKNTFPTIYLKRYFNPKINTNDITIFHSSYYRTMKGKNIRNIVTVHDFIYEKFNTNPRKFVHIIQKKKALQMADGIICISNNTKEDLLEIYPFLETKKIKVIHNGFADDCYFPLNISKNINQVLFVGGRSGYKNFKFVVEVVSKIDNIELGIVGEPLSVDEINLLNKYMPNRYSLYECVDNSKLNKLYNESICLLYLSEYEGFGIPVIEAMASGCPVIALNSSSIPEIAGTAGLLFNKEEIDNIKNSLCKLRDDTNYRNEQIAKGISNSKRFSWDYCFQNTIRFYNELLQ